MSKSKTELKAVAIPFRRAHVFLRRQWLEVPDGDSRTLTGVWSTFKKSPWYHLRSWVFRDGRDWWPATNSMSEKLCAMGMKPLEITPVAVFGGGDEAIHVAMMEVEGVTGFSRKDIFPVSIAGILNGGSGGGLDSKGKSLSVAHMVQVAVQLYFQRCQWFPFQDSLPLTESEIKDLGGREGPIAVWGTMIKPWETKHDPLTSSHRKPEGA